MVNVKEDTWGPARRTTWGNWIGPNSYHAAKFRPHVVDKVYRTLCHDYGLKRGEVVFDPMAGVATGAINALMRGINWVGVEIEPHLFNAAIENSSIWRAGGLWSEGVSFDMFCGDSQNAVEVVKGVLKPGDVSAVVSSPPFTPVGSQPRSGQGARSTLTNDGIVPEWFYGSTPGNLGNHKITSDDVDEVMVGKSLPTAGFWIAADKIVGECHKLLRPGGSAVWVTKDFVNGGKVVPFTDAWIQVCRRHGFVLDRIGRVPFVTVNGVQLGLDGSSTSVGKDTRSFYRRILENDGTPVIEHEDVVFMFRP